MFLLLCPTYPKHIGQWNSCVKKTGNQALWYHLLGMTVVRSVSLAGHHKFLSRGRWTGMDRDRNGGEECSRHYSGWWMGDYRGCSSKAPACVKLQLHPRHFWNEQSYFKWWGVTAGHQHCEQFLGLHPLLPARPVIVPTARLVVGVAATKNRKVPDAERLRREENL